ncbi:MAG: hypothetical protein Q9M17_03360 [Mariprofundus sp.]|nr:hypothetical protein [Mariprofundus sp.]
MLRIFTVLIALTFMSVTFAGSSYADSNSKQHDKYENKDHGSEKDHDRYGDKDERDGRDFRHEQNDNRSNTAGSSAHGPVSNSLNHVGNTLDQAGRKIDQAREWWQFW